MERGARCPNTERVVFLDEATLSAEEPTVVVCPLCHKTHVWDPHDQELRPPLASEQGSEDRSSPH